MVMVAVEAMKEYLPATAMGTPMLCPPPSTSETTGLDMEAIISAMARPASTSPPTVLRMTSSPSTWGLCSAATSCGMRCSYLVVLFCGGSARWPSTWPMIESTWMFCGGWGTEAVPRASMLSVAVLRRGPGWGPG